MQRMWSTCAASCDNGTTLTTMKAQSDTDGSILPELSFACWDSARTSQRMMRHVVKALAIRVCTLRRSAETLQTPSLTPAAVAVTQA